MIVEKYMSRIIICIYLFVLIFVDSESLNVLERIEENDFNKFENIILQTGMSMAITSSWQLLLSLFSRDNCEICIFEPLGEFIETKEQIERRLNEPWLFHLHPAKNITSQTMLQPRFEFLNFVSSYLEMDRSISIAGFSNTPFPFNTKKNLFACNYMLRELINKEFVYLNIGPYKRGVVYNKEYELIEQMKTNPHERYSSTDDRYEVEKRISSNSAINNLCETFLLKLSKVTHQIGIIRVYKLRQYRRKVAIYNKICHLLNNI